MAQETEAACLLKTGATYPERLGLVPFDEGEPILLGFRKGAASIYFGDQPIFHFDLEGRWQRAYVNGVHYLKGLDTTTRVLDRDREGVNLVLRRRTLTFADASDLDASARTAALDVLAGYGTRLKPISPPEPARAIAEPEIRAFLEKVAGWDSAAWFAHRERYLGLYGLAPFVPPDAASAILVQATLGHPGSIAFGGAPASEYYRRSQAEFADHVAAVASLWGRRIEQAKAVYLAGSDLWHEPVGEVRDRIEILSRKTFSLPVTGFLDDFAQPLPDPQGWRMLRDAGLGSMTLGVESGDPAIRSQAGELGNGASLIEAVANLGAAEIACRLVVLIGEEFLDETAILIEAIPWNRGSIVYLIDAEEVAPGSVTKAQKTSFPTEAAKIKSKLDGVLKSRGVKVVSYSLDKQWN